MIPSVSGPPTLPTYLPTLLNKQTKQQTTKERYEKWLATPKGRSTRRSVTRRHFERNRQNLLTLLGGCCTNPFGQHILPYTDGRALQFDHINGGGQKQIKEKFKGSGGVMVAYYLKHPEEAQKDLQILCANCNWIKRHEKRETRPRLG